jgi:hypothetical protein
MIQFGWWAAAAGLGLAVWACFFLIVLELVRW